MGPEVQEDQTLHDLWFAESGGKEGSDGKRDGDRYRDSIIAKLTPFHYRIISAYMDYRDFKIKPWPIGSNRKDIPNFWLRVLRNFQRLESDAQQYKMTKQRMKQDETYQRYLNQEQRKKGKPAQERQARRVTKTGRAPSEEAANNYMAWRQKQITEKRKQEADKHERLVKHQQQQRKLRKGRTKRR